MTGARTPEVLTGARQPRSERQAEIDTRNAKLVPGRRTIPEGKRIFRFVAAKYRLQLTAPRDQHLPDGRIQSGGKAKRVDAVDNFAVLDVVKDKDIIEMMVGVPEDGVEPERWQKPPHTSYKKDFWDLADEIAAAETAQKSQAINVVLEHMKDPEVRAALEQALYASENEDFDPGDKKTKTQTSAEA